MQKKTPEQPADVRMKGFERRATVEDAWAWLDDRCSPLASEIIESTTAAHRVLAEPIVSPVNVPSFRRSMMDGYAVQAADLEGASPYERVPIKVIGESLPSQPAEVAVASGTAVRIMTGAPMPAGADAVLPVEMTESDAGNVFAVAAVAPRKNVGEVGEDIKADSEVYRNGRRLRPQDVGLLCAIGVAKIKVVRRPRVRIVVTGNELLPPGAQPSGTKIVDSNSPMLAALIERDGGIVANPGIVPDDPQAIEAALLDDADVVLVSGGSSVGQEDHAPNLVRKLGDLAIHGIAMRPSSPTGMGTIGHRLVILLPGNPVSCLCAYDFFAGRAIRQLAGRDLNWPYRSRTLPLQRKLVSTVGRMDYARVRELDGRWEPMAISGASVLSSTTRADGFVLIPADSEGYAAGAEVSAFLYDA